MGLNFREILNENKKQIEIDFNSLTTQLTHRPSKGIAREEIIKSFLKKYIPPQIGVTSGEIISIDGQVSNQTDIILYDKNKTPIFIHYENADIIPIEGVYSIIEIKSKLDKIELEDCFNKINKIKQMPKLAYKENVHLKPIKYVSYQEENINVPVLGFVIAYDSIDLVKIKDYLIELQGKCKISKRIDGIYVLKKGMVINFNYKTEKWEFLPSKDTALAAISSNEQFSFFIPNLYDFLAICDMHHFNYWKYINKDYTYGTYLHTLSEEEVKKQLPDEFIEI